MKYYGNAFTLIELLIVVAIIGILASIAVPNFLNAQLRAKLANIYANKKTIQTGIATYKLDYGWAPIDMGPDAENGQTYIALTTPTPYLTSIQAFHDLFFTGGEEDSGKYMAYGGPLHLGQLDDKARIQMFKDANIDYFLFGWGPDRDTDWPWAIMAETLKKLNTPSIAGPNQYGGIFYNPSNGVTSTGDIVSTDSLIIK